MTISRPGPDEYARFLRGELAGEDSRRMIRGLLAAWRTGGGEAANVPAPAVGATSDGGRRKVRNHAETVLRERRNLPVLATRLEQIPAADRDSFLRSEPELRSWLFGEWLIEESHRRVYLDPADAGKLAASAAALINALDPGIYGAPLIADLQGRAWACRGETLRVLSDLRGADEAFQRAEELVYQGTCDALEEARVLELKAALRRDQGRSREAHQLLDEVVSIYHQYRDYHLLGRAFVQKGRVHGRSNEPEESILWLRKGLGLLDPARERYFDLAARQSLMLGMHESGRHREARFLLKASRPEFLAHGSRVLVLRLSWLEGKIYDALGFPEKAEQSLLQARAGFAALGIGFSAAAVSLDLAGLYAGQGRAAEVRELAEEILPIFRSRDLHHEAMAALIAFQQAARVEESSARILSEIRACLDRARSDPRLRCEPV
jgi:tetratricopeptide (TPR) repeat protein